jgi:hypothetical protein
MIWSMIHYIAHVDNFDDQMNLLNQNVVIASFKLMSFSIMLSIWRQFNNPYIVYSTYEMNGLYLYGGMVPLMFNISFVFLVSMVRKVWEFYYIEKEKSE